MRIFAIFEAILKTEMKWGLSEWSFNDFENGNLPLNGFFLFIDIKVKMIVFFKHFIILMSYLGQNVKSQPVQYCSL